MCLALVAGAELGGDPRGTGAPTLKEKKKKYIYIYISILYLGPPFKTFENFPYNFTLISM